MTMKFPSVLLSTFVFLSVAVSSLVSQEHYVQNSSIEYERTEHDVKVDVVVCTEALCPDCTDFYLSDLKKVFDDPELRSIVRLHIIPFGNAHLDTERRELTCQHGPSECDANSYEQCAIWTYPDPEDHVRLVLCLAGVAAEDLKAELASHVRRCCAETGLDFDPIARCHGDETLSWSLQLSNRDLTPLDHTYVPWVVMDGDVLDINEDDFVTEICRKYASLGGGDMPVACTVFREEQPIII
mmetsp:Transcript_14236/g.31145  ORF Transcript_14236/g.31145 Transcript_14236/m.31145 type:complete len:241 (-) Transcript_14236:29-751(-)